MASSSSKASSGKIKGSDGTKYLHDKAFKASLAAALASLRRRVPVQRNYNEIRRIGISTNATPAQIRAMFREIYLLYRAIAPLSIPGSFIYSGDNQRNQGPVAVTIPAVSVEKSTFYIVEISTQIQGDPVLQIPVRFYDGYCLGFRILYPYENPLDKLWYEFGVNMLPRRLFPRVRSSGYDEGYVTITNIQIRHGLLSSIFNHFRGFSVTEITTEDGKLLKDTLFFIFAECQRFLFAQELFFNNMHSFVPAYPMSIMSNIIRDWQDLSFAIMQLRLSELEESMGLNHFGMKEIAEKQLKVFEAKGYAPIIRFRNNSGFSLARLLESSFLLRLNFKLGLKIMMRENGFRKEFPGIEFFPNSLD